MSAHHAEWLSLIEVSGPFLTLPVLERVFPQGLDALDRSNAARVVLARDEWSEAQARGDSGAGAIHGAWVHLVLRETLELGDEVLRRSDRIPKELRVTVAEQAETLVPDCVVVNPDGAPQSGRPRLLVQVWPAGQDLDEAVEGKAWAAPPAERMTHLCRATGVRLGLVTNGERWMLVDAPAGETPGYASWYAQLWSQEPLTLRAFRSLLGARRFFAVAESDTLERMLEESVQYQHQVTEQLGTQVRNAVEVLIQSLDKADLDRNRELLRGVTPERLYEAALTVMMRLVFLFCAEERGLSLLGESDYDAYYAVSTLRGQLREEADRVGVEVLERRQDAWARLLATFRAVYGGIEHEALRLPTLGGSLFDPDRFSFLEGRSDGTSWRDTVATPLPIDNRTVLHLLESLQLLKTKGREGLIGARRLSFRALDVEQIGHVYEGLLDHVAVRLDGPALGLDGTRDKQPEITLDELVGERARGSDHFIEFLHERTGRSASVLRKALEAKPDDAVRDQLLVACGNDRALLDRALPFHALIREDVWGYPQVYRAGSFMVTGGPERRETGTHYTPKHLTEAIVKETLEPIVYVGPSKGKLREEWKLRSAVEILELKVCDMAMGSGAFLVQACRWLAERLVEAWGETEVAGKFVSSDGRVLDRANGGQALARDPEERLTIARRLIAERCLYGVDINPMAVELAKLSLWLVTLAKGRPFGFLDHNLRSGDSLLGIHRLDQLTELTMTPSGQQSQMRLFGRNVERAVRDANELRKQLRETPIRDIRDVEGMAKLDTQARRVLNAPERVADALVGEALRMGGNAGGLETAMQMLAIAAQGYLDGNEEAGRSVMRIAKDALAVDLPDGKPPRRPFHWSLEFPEVFSRDNGGFDAFVGNPPFLGNRLWKGAHGEALQRIVQMVLGARPGKIDLCIAFHRRAVDILRTGGNYGLLGASNIAEGSAIAVGLGEIVKKGQIFFSRKSVPWPGTAAVVVAIVCFHKGSWNGSKNADGQNCERIGPRLECETGDVWEPKVLKEGIFSFEGVNNSKGLAFVVTAESPWFEQLRSERDSLLRPYITGDDITSFALNRIERWALDIADRSLDEIKRSWPVAHRFLTGVVQPTRTVTALKSYKGLYDRWWQFWNHRADLMRRLRRRDKFIAYSKVTKHPICMLAPSDWIYTNKVLLIGVEREDLFAICLSSLFRSWLETYSGGNLGETLTLSISESVAKFPLPNASVSRAGIDASIRFNENAVAWAADHGCGLTEVMNAIHSPDITDQQIAEMRSLLKTIDSEVVTAYGWRDLDIEYDFRELAGASNNDRWRHGLSETTRSQLLQQLLELNREYCEGIPHASNSSDVKKPSRAMGSKAKGFHDRSMTLDLDDAGNE